MPFNLVGLTASGDENLTRTVVAQFSTNENLQNYLLSYPKQEDSPTGDPFPTGSVLFGYNAFDIEEISGSFPIDPT